MHPDGIKPFDIRTNAEWQRLGLNAENRPTITVDPSQVPDQFRPLIPYVERWAITCDVTRGDYFDKQPAADIEAFYRAILPHHATISHWVDEPPSTDAKLLFLVMLKAHCDATPPPPPEEIAETQRRRAADREAKRQHWRAVYERTENRNA